MTTQQDTITLYISAGGAAEAARRELSDHTLTYTRNFEIIPATMRDGWGGTDRGFKVSLLDKDERHVRWL